MRVITEEMIGNFKNYLYEEEKSKATINKYIHDLKDFKAWLNGNELNKSMVLQYKAYLCEKYAPASVNSVLSSLNSFFTYCEWFELRVKNLKIQRQMFTSSNKELSKTEYELLMHVNKHGLQAKPKNECRDRPRNNYNTVNASFTEKKSKKRSLRSSTVWILLLIGVVAAYIIYQVMQRI